MPSILTSLLSTGTAAVAMLLVGIEARTVTPATADLARVPVATSPSERPAPGSRTIVRAPDGLFYADALVRGHSVRFVVDTGASVTVLNAEDAARVGAEPDHAFPSQDMDTVGGAMAMRWSKPAEIRVAGHTLPGIQAALPAGGVRVSLLGQDVLSRLDSLTLRGDSLTLR